MSSLTTQPDHGESEAIAIVGMSCRFSGSATSPEHLWQMLSKGLTGWSSNAAGRFRMDAFWHPQADLSGSFNTRGLHLLKQDPAMFDNGFFGISNVEAKAIDPQHRMMLEVAYEAFEDAGTSIRSLAGSDTAVFCAISNHDYEKILGRDAESSPGYRFTGTGPSMLANRVSYFFDLRGPSITLDTACSSGLVAIHEACKAIRGGEVTQALVGGANLILDPDQTTVMSSMSFLSPHGRCYSFDERADGFGRGEGVAAIMLKSLKQALHDGDSIRAVIRGSGVMQDGRTPAITMPSCEAQTRMIQKVYEKARLDPRDTCYVEAHGTGTTLGDKIEATALRDTFCNDRKGSKLLVGSVKANIGHTESVAGLAGVIKTVLVLEKGVIPPNPTFTKPSSNLPLHKWDMDVPTSMIEWPEASKRRASVNSFGYGGTNGHIILEAADGYIGSNTASNETKMALQPQKPKLYVLSHAVETGLGDAASRLKRFVDNMDGSRKAMDSLALTLSRRSDLDYKCFVAASTREELTDGLSRHASGGDRVFSHTKPAKLCFTFSGQGAQWPGMGRELISTEPVFAESIQRSEELLLQLGADWRLSEELCKIQDSRINGAVLSQPACTAIQIALVDLLASWNVVPVGVVGHSSGEIAAAYAAGMLSAESALRVAYHRGQGVVKLKKNHPSLRGAMLAAGLSAADAQDYLLHEAGKGKAVVACENSPGSVTLSGDETAVASIQDMLTANQIFNRRLVVDAAYHSHHMEFIQDEYRASIQDVQCHPKRRDVSMVSSVDGIEIKDNTLDARYWCKNLTSPVRFVDAMAGVLKLVQETERKDSIVVVEIGPHSALAGSIKQIIKAEKLSGIEYLSILTRNQDASKTAITAAGQLFQLGYRCLDLAAINDPQSNAEKRLLVDLPTYSWTHKTPIWSESRRSMNHRLRSFVRHDLLGTFSADSISEEPTWRNYIRLQEQPWLAGHTISDYIVFPAAGFVSMAVEALKQTTLSANKPWKNMRIRFRQLHLGSALIIPDDAAIETMLMLRPQSTKGSWKEFRIFSIKSNGDSTEHCRGLASVEAQTGRQRDLTDAESLTFVEDVSNQCHMRIDPAKLYRELNAVGLHYTGLFANQKQMRAAHSGSVCRVEIPNAKATMPANHQQPHCIHPSTLDLCIQSAFPVMKTAGLLGSSVVVSSIESLELHSEIHSRPGQELNVATKLRQYGRSKAIADTVVVGHQGSTSPTFMKIKGLVISSAGGPLYTGASQRPEGQSLTHRLEWSIDSAFATPEMIIDHCRLSQAELASFGSNRICEKYAKMLIQRTLASIGPEEDANIKGHHLKLLHWMQHNSGEMNTSNTAFDKNLETHVRATGAHGKTLVHIGSHLTGVLRGEVDGLELLRQDNHLYSMYSYDNYDRGHRQLARYAQLLQFTNPNMRILEIGAGTASTTLPILQALSMRTDCSGRPKIDRYTFTDISTGFFEKAEKKLEKFNDLLEFKRLDIEAWPEQQGIKQGSYDLVIATNVLHATRDICHTLNNVRSLLKPGGHLALMEFTAPTLYTGLIFGMLPGWWLSTDGRKEGPLLDCTSWDERLRISGFTGVDVELLDYENEDHEMSLILSTAGQDSQLHHSVMERLPARLSVDSDSTTSIVNVHMGISSPTLEEVVAPTTSISTDDCEHVRIVQILHGVTEDRMAQQLSKMLNEGGIPTKRVNLTTLVPDGQPIIVLLELMDPFLATCSESNWEKIRQMCQLASDVVWVTSGAAVECTNPMRSLITGLARCLQTENHAIRFSTIDLEVKSDLEPTLDWETSTGRHICAISKRVLSPYNREPLADWEFAVRGDKVLVPRLVEDIQTDALIRDGVSKFHPKQENVLQSDRALGLNIQVPGLLDTLYWVDSSRHSRPVGPDEVRVELKFMSLNFKDIMVAMGQLDDHTALLLEGSGRVIEVGAGLCDQFAVGDLVYVYDFDGLATTSIIPKSNVHRLSDAKEMEEAAAAGVAFATAFYSLRDSARLQEGESLLIHSGAGAVGQAAIMLAQKIFRAGNVFVTVGSDEKRDFISKKFGISSEDIFSSRGLDFQQAIMERTHGMGVDVVLNSLNGEALQKSIELLAPFGRFVEIGKKDLLSPDARLEMRALEKNIQFSSVDLALLGRKRPAQLRQVLLEIFDLLQGNSVKAISPVTIMPVSKIEEACRSMQAGKHVGKLLIHLDPGASIPVQPTKPSAPKLKQDCSYLVVGGTGGLGKATLRLLADLGAKRLITLSRSGADSQTMGEMVEELAARDVDVIVHKGSVLDRSTLIAIRDSCGKYPIRGIVQGAMVLRDSRVENMTYQDWRTAVDPKVHGTWNLHEVFGRGLEFFVLLSSSGGIIGSFSQGNYCAGSTFQDAFARYRASLGLPGRAIDVGFVEGEGYTAENESAAEFVRRQGLSSYKLEEFLLTIEEAIKQPIAAIPSQAQLLCGISRADPSSDTPEAALQRPDMKFSHIWTREIQQEDHRTASSGQIDVHAVLRTCTSSQQALDTTSHAMKLKLARLLAVPIEDIRSDRSIASYGMDSLIAVELRNWLSTLLEAQVQMFELMSSMPFAELSALVARRSRLVPLGVM